MAALSFKKKAFQKKKGKAVFSKAKEYKAKSKRTPIKKSKVPKKNVVEVPATAENSVLKLTGLPFTTKDEAIIKLLKENGIKIEKIHRCDTDTWKSGMAYATVSSTDLLQEGLKLNKMNLEGRYINVQIKRKAEMEGVLQCVALLDRIVRLRGLPYNVKKKDIIEFFKGLPISEDQIFRRKNEADAYVRFNDASTAKKALKKNDCYIGQRYVKVYICKLPQLTQLKYSIINNEGHVVLKKFLGGSNDGSGQTQSSTKKSNLKAASQIKEMGSLDSDEEMEESNDSSEEEADISFDNAVDEPMEGIAKGHVKVFEGAKKIDSNWSQDVLDFLQNKDESCEDDSNSDSSSSLPVTTPKKQKKDGSMKENLSSKGFAVKTDSSMFTEIIKQPDSAVKKSGGAKRTSMVKAKDSEEESVPELVVVTPKQRGTPASLHKRLSTGKKGKRRSMFTATPK